MGVAVKVMDPWANACQVKEEYDLALSIISPDNPVQSLIIAVGHKEFASMSPSQLKALCVTSNKPVIADLKALYDRDKLRAEGFDVFRF